MHHFCLVIKVAAESGDSGESRGRAAESVELANREVESRSISSPEALKNKFLYKKDYILQ